MSNPTITQDTIFAAVGNFIAGLIPGVEIVQGLQNGVATPDAPFIAMTPLRRQRLNTNIQSTVDPYPAPGGAVNYEEHADVVLQIDCYGPLSGDWATMLETMFRSDYAVDAMAPNVCPLYADDPQQIALVDGEANYEQRWMVEAHIQVNALTAVPMQFFTTVALTLRDVP